MRSLKRKREETPAMPQTPHNSTTSFRAIPPITSTLTEKCGTRNRFKLAECDATAFVIRPWESAYATCAVWPRTCRVRFVEELLERLGIRSKVGFGDRQFAI